MKTTLKLPAVTLICALILLNTLSCKRNPPPQVTEAESQAEPVVTEDNSPAPALPTKADLTIQSVKLEKATKKDKVYTHVLVVKVSNNGESIAKGFDLGCTYDCPGGLTKSGGASVVQGGYIAANSEYEYRSLFRIYCEGPPAFLNLKFEIDPKNKVAESNENNNKKTVKVAVPF